ncbi:DYN1_2 [Sanghuangporus sanghuang]
MAGSQANKLPAFPAAQQAQIIRANQRDLFYVYSLREQAENVLRSWLGNRWLSRWDKELELLSKLLYYGLTTGRAQQTLGEEYTNIWQYSNTDNGTPSARKRAALVFLPAFPAYAISRFENRLSGGNERIARVLRRLPSILNVISEMNLAAFYFRGVYYNLANRVLGVKNISSIPENPNSRPPSYSLLGILIIIRLLHRLSTAIRELRRTYIKESSQTSEKGKQAIQPPSLTEASMDGVPISEVLENTPDESSAPIPAEEDENTVLDFAQIPEHVRARRNCTLCLEERTSSCATECGHLFCWPCIIGWGREKVFAPSNSSTAAAVTFITFVQDLKKKSKTWGPLIDLCANGEKTLERFRYQFPDDWLYSDQLRGEWSAYNEILKRKSDSIQEQLAGLQLKIVAEDKIVENKINDIITEWEQTRPVQGNMRADTAMNTINVFEGKLNRVQEEYDLVCRAKEALDLELTRHTRLEPVFEELRDLKAVWTALSGIWAQINELREITWASVQPRKLREQLNALLNSTKEMPTRMRQYAAFEYVQETLRGLLKSNIIVGELKSEALKDRHWKQLFKVLRMSPVMLTTMTLGNVYDMDLKKNESLIKEVIIQAQGEMALEEYIKQVKETWTTYALDLVNYQNKTRLIRGWDDLFTKCSENLNSLTAMKLSPYYKVFEEDASAWEDRLNRIHVLFDVWIDVQRQWVYLEGIFSGSVDIKHLLPVESNRFQSINSEFLTVMKKVNKTPYVVEVLNIPGIQKSLERLADLLSKIQKALGEYLERERASFPRFYFVGDEDLLEIIGNSKTIVRIMKHLKKMFAGIATMMLDEEETEISGIASREGEEIQFRSPIILKDYPKINDWLAKLESEMRNNLAYLLCDAVEELQTFYGNEALFTAQTFIAWIEKYPAQLVSLAIQVAWTASVENCLEQGQSPSIPLEVVRRGLHLLADVVLTDLNPITRRKCEHLITELVHERDVIRALVQQGVTDSKSFAWLYQMRFYLDRTAENPLNRLAIRVANATFPYGWEYLGVPDRLVQTPLTDRCYLTLTQALDSQLGGSPFGPAGTGKTESVKALGVQLGRFVLVFCCDETFDFQAMGRIFVGLCQVGAWGCFDEFNRLEERILSAVSQQVQTIQQGLASLAKNPQTEIELVGKSLKINPNIGIFITTNPGYAGRTALPPNLTKLFRPMAMTRPDRELIAQVMLFSQGFRTAEVLASKIVPFFNLCAEQLSPQPHYDFGLRALKAVLASAGILKRERLINAGTDEMDQATDLSDSIQEQVILIQSVTETIVPKLVADDVPLLTSLLADVFPGVDYVPVDLDALREQILRVCAERRLVPGERWIAKILQLYQIQKIQHGLMMVGPSGSGKTNAWRVLLAALERLDGVEGVPYVIDPKAIHKEDLYGTLDPTTREWNDGLFTHLLRKIVDDVRGESGKRHWIIFDGDVDPEWVENLNSVLDDNKLLTLPNGERLNLPPNVRIMFEVEHLKYATLATVSRCGMIWFSEDVVEPDMVCRHYLDTLSTVPLDADEDESLEPSAVRRTDTITSESSDSPNLRTQKEIAGILEQYFAEGDLVSSALSFAESVEHIMDFTTTRALNTLFSLINKTARNVVEYNIQHSDFPLSRDKIEQYVAKRLLVNIIWAFAGDARLDLRADLGEFLQKQTGIDLPLMTRGSSLIDYDVQVTTGEWISWSSRVPVIEIEAHAVTASDVVVPTIDTIRHEEVLYSWLSEHKPLMLCGPPGSGKTMTLFSALRKLPDMEVVGLNFSSATTPELILKTFEQYCEYRKTPNGVILAPVQIGRWLVVFCDEINLPATDKYGTQRVISFLRQLVECGGFYRTSDMAWVRLERIQFVGACNPPTDPGRVPLSHRFLRHAPLVMVDYPGEISLKQIYGTYNRAMLKVVPNLRAYSEPLTDAMVTFYLASQKRFTSDIQAHYIYSPRELTRWVRGIYEAIKPLEMLSVEGLVRVWAHEALRLFQDRLVSEDEKVWTDENINATAMQYFPTINEEEALTRPILFSNWTSKHYVSVDREILRDYIKARLRVFHEEELDVQLVLFNDVLDHVLRIDRVFRQIQGHLLLIGVSGSGKTTLSRFVAWMNGLSIFQIKVSNKYTGEDFDEDLRTVLRRAGCKGEKICFIMDESNVLDSGFLERMNTLLANAEVPGLFEGDEHSALMTACKEGSQRDGLMLDSHEELYKWFTQQVAKNLHVVFTMNPPENGLASRTATSPALFNRCVLDWFGDWPDQAFYQVGSELTRTLDLDLPSYKPPRFFPIAYRQLTLPPSHREAIVNALVYVHQSLYQINKKLSRRQGRYNYVTPRHYLDFISHYVRLYNEKRDELEEQQRHLHVGLDKLKDTVTQVEELRKSLAIKRRQLEAKNAQANEKLQRMVSDQQEAEQKKAASIEIQAALVEQDKHIKQRREVVMADLADAEPAVLEAQAAVGNIKRQHLQEVRAMANPPEAVKLAMESVCTVLGHKIDSWRSVQGIIRRDDFIQRIVNFDTNAQMTKQVRELMKREYLSRPSFNFETVNRASKACGPLVKWVIAQVRFSEILDKVEPLRNEVQSLEEQAEDTKKQAGTIIKMIEELEASIHTYKEEYALLISETQSIKSEMERVENKVERSMRMLDSLSSERARWEAGSQTFDEEMSTIVGDVLLSAAFLAYGGFFDQHYREIMWHEWSTHLSDAYIKFKSELAFPEYLSTADERLSWQSKSLPADSLCTENAIMLKRFNRYPLIIDPTGQATSFLLNEYKDRKITVTSFLDDAFLKVLESALRFGNPLLIQDVEHLDPILNAVLNKEIRRTGGRVLIRLGSQDIDFSPSFTMFLSTRDPSVEFSPDICSRVTFVNFTMTRSSLQSQTLDQVLKVERPDTERKRTDLMKIQGEFRLRLRTLEKLLLQALNESTGNILDDDKVINTLETLKKEAAEITRKVEETDTIMREVEQVTAEYMPIAQACSSVFFILEQLNLVNHFYQFSLSFFLDIFDYILHHNPHLQSVTDHVARRRILFDDLFLVVFRRTSRALLHQDHVMLATLLAQAKLRGADDISDEYEFLLESGESVLPPGGASESHELTVLSTEQQERLNNYAKHPLFKPVLDHVHNNQDEWVPFLQSTEPEIYAPSPWEPNSAIIDTLRYVLLIKCFRPDRLVQSMGTFLRTAFEKDLTLESDYNLADVVQHEVPPATPLALVSVPGYDASYRVEVLVQSSGIRCSSVAMGSQEGFSLADQAIAVAARQGTWVLLKNVHLAPSWLGQLEKKLQTLNPNRNFRLFLTMEANPVIPVNILRQSRIIMNEPPPGIKANLLDSLRSIPQGRLAQGPAEKSRLYFLLAWFHAIVQERLRYAPLGWSKKYDFNDSDMNAAFGTIDVWISSVAKGRANVDPVSIPWDAVRTLVKQSVYGGRIDSDFDQKLLDTFVDSLFTPAAYNLGFDLVPRSEGKAVLTVPEGTKVDHFLSWVQELPDREPPSWLSLPPTAERVIALAQSNDLLIKLRKMKSLVDDDVEEVKPTGPAKSLTAEQPAWMRALLDRCREWLTALPESFNTLAKQSADNQDPLNRLFLREGEIGRKLLSQVRRDLADVIKVCEGSLKQTNHLRSLLSALTKGTIPPHWMRYKVKKMMSVSEWIPNLARRLAQLDRIAGLDSLNHVEVWLGGLFFPEAYVTATRQAVAHRKRWSLETLDLRLDIERVNDPNAFIVDGLVLEGASWSSDKLVLNNGENMRLNPSQIRWVQIDPNEETSNDMVTLPVYLNNDRSDVLFTVKLPFSSTDGRLISMRAVCLTADGQNIV